MDKTGGCGAHRERAGRNDVLRLEKRQNLVAKERIISIRTLTHCAANFKL
jgi:hypothetical protein